MAPKQFTKAAGQEVEQCQPGLASLKRKVFLSCFLKMTKREGATTEKAQPLVQNFGALRSLLWEDLMGQADDIGVRHSNKQHGPTSWSALPVSQNHESDLRHQGQPV